MGEYQSLTMESLQSEVLRLERLANSDLDTLRRQIAASTAPSRDVERGRSIGESLLQQSENIRMCLSRLEELQELMQERASTVLDNHKVQRHKHVLSDLHKEFSSLQKRVDEVVRKDELLGNYIAERERLRAGMTGMDHVLRERGALASSDRAADEVIAKALATREALDRQRNSIIGTRSTLSRINDHFPALGTLMGNISKRKKANDIVLAVWVGALCCAFVYFVFLS
eukprot:c6108_g1_i2.p1 GENE.c6108_g1_i2~~c6108_g1_i2.p1  ORF type:complete len:244 (+),score=51.72 c6108_g1_i2:50-733(+)